MKNKQNNIMEKMNLQNRELIMSSREIAQITGKQHSHVLRDCDSLNQNYENLRLPKIGELFTNRQLSNGGTAKDRYYELTRIQTFDLMTGYNAELRIKVNRRWEELEKKQLDFSDANVVLQLAKNWKEQQDKKFASAIREY